MRDAYRDLDVLAEAAAGATDLTRSDGGDLTRSGGRLGFQFARTVC